MSANTYPTKNPFPHQGVSSIEGARLETRSHVSEVSTQTLLLDAVDRTYQSLRSYLTNYQPHGGMEGRTVVVHGDHGTGKTHTIRYVTNRLLVHGAKDGIPSLTQFYGKADGAQFGNVYRELMGYLDVRQFMMLNAAFVRSVAAENVEAEKSEEHDQARLVIQLREDRTLLGRLFDSGVVEEGAVQLEQAKDMGQIPRRPEFENALYYGTTVPDLRQAAFDWFSGRSVDERLRKRLGVHGPIESAEDVKSSLWLLARLYNRAGQPLIIYIDQLENLVLNEDGSRNRGNIAILRSLFELIAREQGALVLAGTSDAWRALTPDMHQRVGNHVHELTALKLTDARNVVALYLTPPSQSLEDSEEDEERREDAHLFPFQAGSIREMLRFGGGNLRRLLQLSSAVIEVALPTKEPITKELVENTVRKQRLRYFDKETALDDIRRIITQRALPFGTAQDVQGTEVDFVVGGQGGQRKLLIKVWRAVFHDDESLHALESLNLIETARQLPEPTIVVLVAVGYASPEITERIRKVADDLIVYNPESFPARFRPVLDSLETVESAGVEAAETTADKVQSQQIENIRREIEALSIARSEEAKITEERFRQLLAQQASSREAERRDEIWRTWVPERVRILQETQTVRRKRETQDLDELESLRKSETWNRYKWLLGAMVLLFSGAYFGAPILLEIVDYNLYKWPLAYVTVAFMLTLMLFFPTWIHSLIFASLARKFRTREELRRAARRVNILRVFAMSSTVPQARYAVAVLQSPRFNTDRILNALGQEPAGLVRCEMARWAGRELSVDRLPNELEPGSREEAYFIEAVILKSENSDLPKGLKESERNCLLAAISGQPVDDPKDTSLLLRVIDECRVGRGSWANAFKKGLSQQTLPNLSKITQTEVRAAIDALSPFDSGGLGTIDELKNIRKVDDFYLFFRQLLFVMERDVFRP